MSELDHHRFVIISYPPEKEGKKYYGCHKSCEKCKNTKSLRYTDFYLAIHCLVCHADMLLDEDRDLKTDPGYEIVDDKLILCTNCYNNHIKKLPCA
jgi:hypothetical protein